MKLEYKILLRPKDDWKPLDATSLGEAVFETASMAVYYGVEVRDAETKEIVVVPYKRNGGMICDMESGPCSGGATH